MPLSLAAVDCIQRGLANLRANWELAPARLAQSLLASFLVLLGLLPLLALLGVGVLEIVSGLASDGAAWTPVPDPRSGIAHPPLGLVAVAAAATLLLWLLAALVYCFFEGGILGVLVSGDRQAPPGTARREWFRTYSRRNLLGWGGRLARRLLGLWLIATGLCAVWTLVSGLWLGLATLGGQRWGAGAGVGIGCGGALPVAFGWLVILFWWQIGQVVLAEERATFWTSLGEAGRIVGRRLGGLLLVALVVLGALLALNVVFLPLSIGIELALAEQAAARLAAGTVLALAQWLGASLLAVLYSGTLVALAGAERRAAGGGER